MARTSLTYPKILDSRDAPLGQCIAFEKYDGTNLHWVWEKELGWYAFGMRRNRYDFDSQGIAEFCANHPGYEEAVPIFEREFLKPLLYLFVRNKFYDSNQITVFTEFLGANSFAGLHHANDPKFLVLFDVQTASGMLSPEQFVEDFANLNIARVVYRGKLTGKFADDVRTGKYDVAEGVVCKGVNRGAVWMAKIKTNAYQHRFERGLCIRVGELLGVVLAGLLGQQRQRDRLLERLEVVDGRLRDLFVGEGFRVSGLDFVGDAADQRLHFAPHVDAPTRRCRSGGRALRECRLRHRACPATKPG